MATRHQASDDLSGYPTHPAAEQPRARGDAITGDRYWSKDFAARVVQRNGAVARMRQRLLQVGNPARRNFNDLLVEHRRADGRLARI